MEWEVDRRAVLEREPSSGNRRADPAVGVREAVARRTRPVVLDGELPGDRNPMRDRPASGCPRHDRHGRCPPGTARRPGAIVGPIRSSLKHGVPSAARPREMRTMPPPFGRVACASSDTEPATGCAGGRRRLNATTPSGSRVGRNAPPGGIQDVERDRRVRGASRMVGPELQQEVALDERDRPRRSVPEADPQRSGSGCRGASVDEVRARHSSRAADSRQQGRAARGHGGVASEHAQRPVRHQHARSALRGACRVQVAIPRTRRGFRWRSRGRAASSQVAIQTRDAAAKITPERVSGDVPPDLCRPRLPPYTRQCWSTTWAD